MTQKRSFTFWLTLLLTAVLGGCAERQVGVLEVAISGLPAGAEAAVDVVGPNGFAERLRASATVSPLPVGPYTVTAEPVGSAAGTYTGTVDSPSATVAAGTTTRVSVSYSSGGGGNTDGDISGTVSIVSAGEAVAGRPTADFVPGEAIVKFRPGVQAQVLSGVRPLRDLGLEGTGLYELSGLGAQSVGAEADTLRQIAELSARADVEYAHPNYLLEATAEPNDPLYARQWHLRALNLPAAWDQTTGSAEVTVAVIDSGVLPGHPDLAPKLLPGYDFVEADFSGDGDGRDGDPTDPGGSFHGSHVAGTAAASTNDGVGVAGVSWGARLLPVRVLGVEAGAGTLADAIDGILWSVGASVPGTPRNPNPADVLNLSLGGDFLCSQAQGFQEAFDRAAAAGAAVIVAAGNDNSDASYFTPSSCGGVVVVGATTFRNERAPYSNFGARIDVMAPGGNLDEDADADGFPDGVLSSVFDPAGGGNTYAYFQGTSMAAPHVAGLVALMKSVQPGLTPAEVLGVLRRTARPLTAASCRPGCGAGLVDAAAALAALSTPAPVTPDFTLALSPATVSLRPGGSAAVTVLLRRSGGFAGDVTFSVAGAPVGLSAGFAPPATGGDRATLTLAANSELSGSYTLQVQGVGGGVSKTATLSVEVGEIEAPAPEASVAGAYVFYCPAGATRCEVNPETSVRITENDSSAPYTLTNVPPGTYQVFAWKDLNGSGQRDSDEPFGSYPSLEAPAAVTPPADGVDVTIIPTLGTQTLGTQTPSTQDQGPTVTVSPEADFGP